MDGRKFFAQVFCLRDPGKFYMKLLCLQITSEMSIRTRALVFSTFFGSCIAIGLLLVSLTTNHWVRASPKRLNSSVRYAVLQTSLSCLLLIRWYANQSYIFGMLKSSHAWRTSDSTGYVSWPYILRLVVCVFANSSFGVQLRLTFLALAKTRLL